MKKIIVASHERCGTHFLMNSIADNFGYISDPWIDLDWENLINPHSDYAFKTFLLQAKDQDVRNVIKTHFPADFFQPFLPEILPYYHILHIQRALHPTMRSFRKYIEELPWHEGPRILGGYEDDDLLDYLFMESKPEGGMLRYQKYQHKDIRSRFTAHKHGWESMSEMYPYGVTTVFYEDLNEDFDNTIQIIGRKLGFDNKLSYIHPLKSDTRQVDAKILKETFNDYTIRSEASVCDGTRDCVAQV